MSLSSPSHVSPTTGSDQSPPPVPTAVDGMRDERVSHDADTVRVRDRDGAAEQTCLADPLEPGQLPVAVEPMAAGEHRIGPDIARRAAGSRSRRSGPGPSPDDERPVALDQRRVTDAHAGDVGDRIVGTGCEAADDQAQFASAHVQPLLPGGRVGHRRGGDPIIAR